MPTGSWSSIQLGLRGAVRTPSGARSPRGTIEVIARRPGGGRTGTASDASSRMTSLADAEPAAGAQVVLEQQQLVDALDALDGLDQLGHDRGVEVDVERPARCRPDPPCSGLTIAGERVEDPLAHHRRPGARARPWISAATLTPLVVRGAELEADADHAALVEVLGDAARPAAPGARSRRARARRIGRAAAARPAGGPAEPRLRRGRQRARATSIEASRVSRSKSPAVTARWPVRSVSGPRTLASVDRLGVDATGRRRPGW